MTVVIAAIAFSVCLTCLLASRLLYPFVIWGVCWSLACGAWLVAPELIRVHNLFPATPIQWLVIAGAVTAIAAVFGALFGTLAGGPLALGLVVAGRRAVRPGVLAALWTFACVPLTYLGLSVWIEWSRFDLSPAIGWSGVVAVGMGTLTALVLASIAVERRPVRPGHRALRFTGLRYGALAAVAGFCVLPLRVPGDARPTTEFVPPPLQRASPADDARTPLLVIGLDGGTWTTLRPLMDRGALPALSRLVDSGVHGEIEALWPPYWSSPAWGAIVTGYSQEEIGVHEDLLASAPGLPPFEFSLRLNLRLNPVFVVEQLLVHAGVIRAELQPRRQIRRPPIWERLSAAGVTTAVIRFPFTQPARGQADAVVANTIAPDLWSMVGLERVDRETLVSPPALARDVLARFDRARDPESPALKSIFPHPSWPHPRGAVVHPVEVLHVAFDFTEKTFDVTERVLSGGPAYDAVFLYLGNPDNIAHAFWQYRFPGEFPDLDLQPDDVRELGPVIDRYLTYLDGRIAAVLATFPTAPNVLIVADHGVASDPSQPMWRGWHSKWGVFIAAGPDIQPRSDAIKVSYYDVVPTALRLLGMEIPGDLRGAPVVEKRVP